MDQETSTPAAAGGVEAHEVGGRYAWFVLTVLVLVYVLNFVDRQILSILAEAIKADVGLTDAEIGFLYGTAFAVFYALFGIPLGRLADMWVRGRLISVGLAFWSLMTAASGLATNFVQLGAARIGVGVGEASATPAAFSMLSDYFPVAKRATVLAIYSTGIYIGAGLGLGIGGVIVDGWNTAYAAGEAPLGLRGWQVAFIAVGSPGILLAILVAFLKEPKRGFADGIHSAEEATPFRKFWVELIAVIPPFTVLSLLRQKASPLTMALNVGSAFLFAALAWLLIATIGDPAQWIALAIGLYATVSWAQGLKIRDPVSYEIILKTPTLLFVALGFAMVAFTTYGAGFWSAPYAIRVHGVDAAEVGLILGGIAATGGLLGVATGGILGDFWRRHAPAGRIYTGMIGAVGAFPFAYWIFETESITTLYILGFPFNFFSTLWIGAGASTVQDLVLPRMRGTASAAYLLVITFIGLALGPYSIGKMSESLDDLGLAVQIGLFSCLLASVTLFFAAKYLKRDQAALLDRARSLGEPDVTI